MDLDQPVEKPVRLARAAGQQHKEAVVAVKHLTGFEQVAPEQPDNRATGCCAQPPGASGQPLRPAGPRNKRPRGRGDGVPHRFVERALDSTDIGFAVGKRVPGLLEIEGPVGHVRDDGPGLGPDNPAVPGALRRGPCRHPAWRPIGENPLRPACVVQREGAAQFNSVHAEHVQHVVVHDRKLLHGVVDIDRSFRQPEEVAQPGIGERGYAGRAVTRQVKGDTVGFAVIQGCPDSLSGVHRMIRWAAAARRGPVEFAQPVRFPVSPGCS